MKTKVLSLPDDVNPTKSTVEQIEPNLSINCYSIFERNRHDRNRHGLERQNFVRLVRLQFSVRSSTMAVDYTRNLSILVEFQPNLQIAVVTIQFRLRSTIEFELIDCIRLR